jgi:hypothetical protein
MSDNFYYNSIIIYLKCGEKDGNVEKRMKMWVKVKVKYKYNIIMWVKMVGSKMNSFSTIGEKSEGIIHSDVALWSPPKEPKMDCTIGSPLTKMEEWV